MTELFDASSPRVPDFAVNQSIEAGPSAAYTPERKCGELNAPMSPGMLLAFAEPQLPFLGQ
ncbi:hypothetical protein SUNI508_05387 [Seiridium unicorne]|uniref:Uncharacterized protein n=1 Tax=Seiridium unicorne TaxID=138068 RepID=A0ABR2V4L9_9PEZI